MSQYTEGWGCADSAALTCALTWTEGIALGSDTTFGITSGRARGVGPSSSGSGNRAEHDLASLQQSVSARLVTFTHVAGGIDAYLLGRLNSGSPTTCYGWGARNDGAGFNGHRLFRCNAGVVTTIATLAQAPVEGELLAFSIQGETLDCYVDGIRVLTATDASIGAGTRGGFYGWLGGSAGNIIELDDWQMADIPVGTSNLPPVVYRRN